MSLPVPREVGEGSQSIGGPEWESATSRSVTLDTRLYGLSPRRKSVRRLVGK